MEPLTADGMSIFVTGIVFGILATIAVALRLLTRSFVKAKYGWDDWWIIFTLLAFYAYLGLVIFRDIEGEGPKDPSTPSLNLMKLDIYLEVLAFTIPAYVLAATACKFSILCLYRRIFTVALFRRWTLIFGVFVVLWFVIAEVFSIVQCIPVDKSWKPWEAGFCLNFDIGFMALEVIETIGDAILLALPIRMISNLQLSKRNKVTLSMVSLLGGFVIITGVIRIALTYQPYSFYVSYVQVLLWSNVHLGSAIICACLPTYRPLLARIAAFTSSLRDEYGSLISLRRPNGAAKSSEASKSSNSRSEHFDASFHFGYEEFTERDNVNLVAASAVPMSNKYSDGRAWPANAIAVRSTFEVV